MLEDNGEVRIRFSSLPNLFQFYFNSSPSQLGKRSRMMFRNCWCKFKLTVLPNLDPNYQTGDTLTEKGRQYSRKAGSGIAIIEVSLQHGQNSQCEILVGKRGKFSNQKFTRLLKKQTKEDSYNFIKQTSEFLIINKK